MTYILILIFAALSLHFYQKNLKYAKKLKKITAIALELEKICNSYANNKITDISDLSDVDEDGNPLFIG
tara:strand:- start:2663 stop:2869 length:207 start_codon:yes stop_codon:yes gene_type:complete